MNKKLLGIAILLAIVAAVAVGFYFMKNKGTDSGNKDKPFSAEKKELEAGELAKGFPENMPIETGSSIIRNYESTASDGRVQSTLVSTTSSTLTQAVKIYVDFFVSQGWVVASNQSPDANNTTALLRRKDDALMIVGRNDVTAKEKTVEITLTEASKSN
jgi:hypothetical protein